jgi:hypothetical protein
MAHSFSYQTAMANPLNENSQQYSLSRREESSQNKTNHFLKNLSEANRR